MKKLTDKQKEFILQFFKDENCAGWKNVATSLINNGYSVIPGSKSLWHGGIGNFIQTEEAVGFEGCIKLVFNLKEFLNSKLLNESYEEYLREIKIEWKELQAKSQELGEKFFQISELKNVIKK